MSRSLPTSDFRAIRIVLEPDDFALSSGEPDLPPSDLIDQNIWHGIITLPDDVSVRTSNHYGSELKTMYELWGVWLEAIGDGEDQLSRAMVETIDEAQAIIFNTVHGYYRQAIGCLRNMLDLVALGSYCQICHKIPEFDAWLNGQEEIRFGTACDGLWQATCVQPLSAHLHAKLNDSFFDPKTKSDSGGWARRLYAQLSKYTHSRPPATNAFLWSSNGPIFVPRVFWLTFKLYCETFALCYLLVKLTRPTFILPDEALHLFKPAKRGSMRIASTSYRYLFQKRR